MSQAELWLLRLYPVCAVLAPALFVPVYIRPFDSLGVAKSASRRLLLGAVGVTAVVLLAQVVIESGRPSDLWRIIWSVALANVGGVVVFLFLVRPVLVAVFPVSDDMASSNIRTATLAPRHRLDPVPTSLWLVGWVLYGIVVVLSAQAVAQGDHPLKLAGLVCWPATALGAKLSLTDPEPLTRHPSPELLAAIATLRTQRVWLLVGLGLGVNVFLGMSALALRVDTWQLNLLALLATIAVAGFCIVWSRRLLRQRTRVHELMVGSRGP